MGSPRLVVPEPVYRLEGVTIDYDLTPRQAVELLGGCGSDIISWPADQMLLWNGGNTGVVENAILPFLWPRQLFITERGRQQQVPIGFVWPVEIASLALPENDPQRIRKKLYDLGIWTLVALRQSDEELLQLNGDFYPFCLDLDPHYFRFCLGLAAEEWDGGGYVLPGSLEAP